MIETLEQLKEKLQRKRGRVRYMSFPPNKRKRRFVIKDYVYHRQSNYKHKYFTLDLIELHPDDWERGRSREIRIGYYIIGKNGRMKGKWTWGQFCPLIPKEDLKVLLGKAKSRGLI